MSLRFLSLPNWCGNLLHRSGGHVWRQLKPLTRTACITTSTHKRMLSKIPFKWLQRFWHSRSEAATFSEPTQEFVRLNKETIENLATFLNLAEGFTIGFVEINFLADRDVLQHCLEKHPKCIDICFLEFGVNQPKLECLKDELVTCLDQISIHPDKKLVLWINGLEPAIGISDAYPLVLKDLNLVRDAFADSVPYPVLICLPNYTINRVIQYAPDFWRWKSGFFRCQTRRSTQKLALSNTIGSDRIRGSLHLEEWQNRIDTLERLAMEYCPSSGLTESELANYCRVLSELGIAFNRLGKPQKALLHLQKAIAYTGDQAALKEEKALALHELGSLKANQGEIDDAIYLYQQSLDLTEQTADIQAKAATLRKLGGMYQARGDSNTAQSLFQASLTIAEEAGNLQGIAESLDWLAGLKKDQGSIEEAIALYQKSLLLHEKIDNIQGKATALHCLGMLNANQGKIDAAIALYQQSLDIKEQIGDVQGKAATLHQLGLLKARQGNVEAAITFYQQSLNISEQIGDIKTLTATLHQLGLLKASHGEMEAAIALYQQSLDRSEQIDDVRTKATTLHQLGIFKADQGAIDAAILLFEASLKVKRASGDVSSLPPTLDWLAFIAEEQGSFPKALTYRQEAFKIAQCRDFQDAADYRHKLERLQASLAKQTSSLQLSALSPYRSLRTTRRL